MLAAFLFCNYRWRNVHGDNIMIVQLQNGRVMLDCYGKVCLCNAPSVIFPTCCPRSPIGTLYLKFVDPTNDCGCGIDGTIVALNYNAARSIVGSWDAWTWSGVLCGINFTGIDQFGAYNEIKIILTGCQFYVAGNYQGSPRLFESKWDFPVGLPDTFQPWDCSQISYSPHFTFHSQLGGSGVAHVMLSQTP